MAEIEDNIIRSEEVQDVIGKVPPWIVRSGTIVLFVFFILLILISCIIKYPDIVVGEIVVTCKQPPAKLVARSSGRIKLLVKNGQYVLKDSYVALIENTADYNDMLVVKEHLPDFEKISEDPIILYSSDINIPLNLNLGETQNAYNDFSKACNEYKVFLSLQKSHKRIKDINNQIEILNLQNKLLSDKVKTHNRELSIVRRQYQTDSLLYIKKSISRIELEKSEERFISSIKTNQNLAESKLITEEEIQILNGTINDLFVNNSDDKSKLEALIKNTFKILNSSFLLWERNYALVAKFSGKVSLFDYWNNYQYVNTNDEVAYIIAGSDSVFAKLYVKGNRFGKVKNGQKVKITLDNYPPAEYGILLGKVISIVEVNKDNVYCVDVSLSNGLITNYKETIEFKHEMNGVGEIITEDLSLLERFFYQARSVFQKKYKQGDIKVINVK